MTDYHGISSSLRAFFIGACLLLGCSSQLPAQPYSYRQYTVDDGLPTNAVYGGLQDSRGYIWFYTEKGVSRFDGYSFTNFTVRDGLPANDIFMLSEDAQGRLWPHSFGRKVVVIDGDTVLTLAENTTSDFLRFNILEDGRNVWFVDNNEGYAIRESEGVYDTLSMANHCKSLGSRVQAGVGYPYKWDTTICFDPGRAHVLQISYTSGTVVKEFPMDGLDERLIRLLSMNGYHSFCTFGEGVLVRPFSDHTVYYLDFGNRCVTSFDLREAFGKAPELVRQYVQDNEVQIQTDLGVLVLNEGLQPVDLFITSLPAAIRTDRAFRDRSGNYWACSRQKGVFFLTAEERNARAVTGATEEEGPAILCLEEGPEGTLYAGTKRGAVYRLEEGRHLRPLLAAASALYNDVVEAKAIAATASGGLWAARQSIGLEYYDPNRQILAPFSPRLSRASILNEEEQSPYFMGFGKDNLHLFIKGLAWNEEAQQLAVARGQYSFVLNLREPESPTIRILSSRRAHAVDFGPDGAIWMGHVDGLAVYDGKGEHYFGDDPELGRKNIWDLAVCPDGKAWVGTDGYGLYLFSKGKATPIRGTGDDIISDVAIGPEGKVWIATNRGVKCIVPGSSPDSSYVEQVLTTNNGLPTIEANAVFADEDFVYVGTDAGLTIIDRSLPFRDTTPPLLIMDEVKVNGQRVPVEEGFQLRHFQNELELAYTGISYKSFGNITYEYQLENADKAMQRTSARRVRYTSLQPGTYTFHLRAIDIKGVPSAPLPPMVFTIRPPWWKTRLALFCGALLLAAAVWGGYRWRVHIIRRRAAAETAINKRFAELELQALQSQMNPHFIFNSLGAIQHFIQENDKKQADLYLSKFAFLMRLFLESSKNKYLSLAEELQLIKLYVELEQLRFRGKFDFELYIEESIGQHTEMVPTMLLQPFVENAINHGLFHKEGRGRLQLSATRKGSDGIRVVVEDNGIGRQRAMDIRRQSNKNYKSRALQITQERLQTLQEAEGYHIEMRVEDLYGEARQPEGTRVVIDIPEME